MIYVIYILIFSKLHKKFLLIFNRVKLCSNYYYFHLRYLLLYLFMPENSSRFPYLQQKTP